MREPVEESKLEEATRALEAVLEKPVVPGELSAWAQASSECCSRVLSALRAIVEVEHPECYAAIETYGPDLMHRIQQMREEDEALIAAAYGLDERTTRLAAEAERRGSREALLEEDRTETVQRGIDLVVRIRRQESALRTWHSEAFYRDRGTGD